MINTEFQQILEKNNILYGETTTQPPFRVVCRNYATDSMVTDTIGIEDGQYIFHKKETAHADGGKGHHAPIVEFFLDTDKTPLLTFDRVRLMGYAVEPYVMRIIDLDYILKDLFQQIGFTLVDFEAGFGRDADGRFLVNKLDIDNMTIWKNNVDNKYLIGSHKYILKHLLEVS